MNRIIEGENDQWLHVVRVPLSVKEDFKRIFRLYLANYECTNENAYQLMHALNTVLHKHDRHLNAHAFVTGDNQMDVVFYDGSEAVYLEADE